MLYALPRKFAVWLLEKNGNLHKYYSLYLFTEQELQKWQQ
jgi:hypothetical protein